MTGTQDATSSSDLRRSRTSSYDKAKVVGQNVMPVFNNPTESSSSSSYWGWPWQSASDSPYGTETPPPLTPGVLPDVELSDFTRYLAAVTERFRRFEGVRGASEAAQLSEVKQGEGLLAAMQQVPAVFFHEDFSLERPETYEQVNPDDTDDGRLEKVEELSSYMDVIETNLLKEIGVRSGSFFEATGLIQDLEAVIQLASRQIRELRGGVAALDEEMLQTAVQVQGLQRRRRNLVAVVEKLRAVESVLNAQTALQLLLPQGDFTAVLDVLEELRGVLGNGDLEGLAAFRHLEEEAAEVEATVSELMAAELLQAVSLSETVDRAVSSATSNALRRQEGKAAGDKEDRGPSDGGALLLDEGLHTLVMGLVRTGQLAPVLGSFRNSCAVETKRGVRVLVEKLLPELLERERRKKRASEGGEEEEGGAGGGGGGGGGEGLQARLQQLSPEGFLLLLGAVLELVRSCLSRAAAVRDLVCSALESGRVLRSKQAGAARECAEAVHAAAEAAHGRWGKLLAARLPVVADATVPQLCELSAVCERLCAEAEARGSSRGSAALRGVVQQQARAFLEGVHKRHMGTLSALLDKETWAAALISSRHREILDAFVARSSSASSSSPSPPRASEAASAAAAETASEAAQAAAAAAAAAGGGSKAPPESLVLHGQRFHLVGTALEVLGMLEEYYGFMVAVPGFGSEVAHRVVELIKVFNSRSCQLVLGAGAMAAAGLKSITAKHLALSCQCLSFFVALQPEVREVFSDGAHMAEHRKALLAPEMGRLLQDLTLHRDEIYSKLVAIMRERLLAGARQLPQAAEKWGAGAAAAGGGTKRPRPTAFAEGTAKQLRVLRSVLVPLLNADDLTAVFGRISGLFGATLAESYARLEDPGGAAAGGGMSAWEAQRCADSVHLLQALQELPVGRQDLEANLQPLHRFCKQRYGAAPEIGDAHHATTPSSSASSRRASSGGAAVLPPATAAAASSAADGVAKTLAEDLPAATQEVPESGGVAESPAVPAEPVAPAVQEAVEAHEQAKEQHPGLPKEEVAKAQEQQVQQPEHPKEEEEDKGLQEQPVHPKEEEERDVEEQQQPKDEDAPMKEEALEEAAAANVGREDSDSAAARGSEDYPSSAAPAAAAAVAAAEAPAAEELKGREPQEAAGPEEPAEELKEAEGEAETGEEGDGWGGEEEDADGWGGEEDGDGWEGGAAAEDE